MSFKVGDRVKTPQNTEGTVKYVGKVSYAKGTHVGVVLDTASGDNDGKKRGKRYFSCKRKHGIIHKSAYFTKIRINPLHTLLVEGYIRQIQNDIQQTISPPIIKLCFNFYLYFAGNNRRFYKKQKRCSAMHPPKVEQYEYSNSFIWNISEAIIMEKMKSCLPGEYWDSKFFCTSSKWCYLNHLKWRLRLHPNGDIHEHKGNVMLSIRLLTLSSFVQSVRFKYKMNFVEGNTMYENSSDVFSIENTESNWQHKLMSTKELQKYNEWTFKVEIEIFNVVYDTSRFRNKSTQTGKWNCKDQPLKSRHLNSIVIQHTSFENYTANVLEKATQT
eukprot:71639_1